VATQPAAQVTVRQVELPAATRSTTTRAAPASWYDGILRVGRWLVRAEPGDAQVPWRLIYEPSPETAYLDEPAEQFDPQRHVEQVPVIRIPEHLWPRWMTGRAAGAAGVHYQELTLAGPVRILYTLHPQEDLQGQSAGPISHGTRVEATLLAPIELWVDETIVVQTDVRPDVVQSRVAHEQGHAASTIACLIAALRGAAGEEDRNQWQCELVWRYRHEKVARPWEGHLGGDGKLLTLRTYVTLIPPTHWTVTVPQPPDQIDQEFILAVNKKITSIQRRFEQITLQARQEFHRKHGQYEVDKP
jgi:hypothetical protein